MYKLYDTDSVIFLLSSVLLTLQKKIKSLNKYTESLTIKGIFHFGKYFKYETTENCFL